MKKVLLFIVLLSFCVPVMAADDLLVTCNYKTKDASYKITFQLENNGVSLKAVLTSLLVQKYDASTSGYSGISDFRELGSHEHGLYPVERIFDKYSYEYFVDDKIDEFFKDVRDNPNKYCPILVFDAEKNPYLVGSYYDPSEWNETVDTILDDDVPDDYNLNLVDSSIVEKLLSGKFTTNPYAFSMRTPYDYLNGFNDGSSDTVYLDGNIYFADSSTNLDIDIDGEGAIPTSNDICVNYYYRLKHFRVLISGEQTLGGFKSGVCTDQELNSMQVHGSLYDVQYKFDSSTLSPKCRNAIFDGDNAYIETILNSQSYYNSIATTPAKNDKETPKSLTIKCLAMQSEYLIGIGLLSAFTPVVDKTDESGCSLIGQDTIDFLNDLFSIFKIISVILCIYLGVTDGYKAITSGKEDEVKKFQSKLTKRIIALVIVFLIPLFVNVVIDVINQRYLKNNINTCSGVSK